MGAVVGQVVPWAAVGAGAALAAIATVEVPVVECWGCFANGSEEEQEEADLLLVERQKRYPG